MPLESPPTRGFAEYQRTAPWDSQPLYSHDLTVEVSPEDTPPIDVSRWAYIGGFDTVLDQPVEVVLTWFTDAAGSVGLGTRTFILSPLVSNGAQYRLPNLGPFLQVSWTSLTGANFRHRVALIGTNRVNPLEMIPTQPVVIDSQNQPIGATTTATLYPTDCYAGPLQITAECSQAGSVTVSYLTSGNVWDTLFFQTVAAATWVQFQVVVPAGVWRIGTRNTSGVAGTYFTIATPSLTGAT